jgi:pilus assembly protein Flp/PilA
MTRRFDMRANETTDSHRGPARRAVRALLADERGGEVIEWALVAGLVVIATIAVVGAFGTKVLARWNTVNSGL